MSKSDKEQINYLENVISDMDTKIQDLEFDKKIVQAKLDEAVSLLKNMIEDLETPYRLGLGDEPNPQWDTLNKSREFLAKGEK